MDACSRKPVETAAEAAKVVAWAVVGARENSLHGIASELAFVGAYLTRPAADPGGDGELVARLRKRHTLVPGCPDDPLALLINPDGPEAADRLETQAADIARLREEIERLTPRYAQPCSKHEYLTVGCSDCGAILSPNPTHP